MCTSGMTAYADSVISAPIGTAVRIHTDAPEPKKGGGDFYTVKVSSAEGMAAKPAIPETTLTFSREGTFPVEISVIHITKGSCGGVESSVYSKQMVIINSYKVK